MRVKAWLKEINKTWPLESKDEKSPKHHISLLNDKILITLFIGNEFLDLLLDDDDWLGDPKEQVKELKNAVDTYLQNTVVMQNAVDEWKMRSMNGKNKLHILKMGC